MGDSAEMCLVVRFSGLEDAFFGGSLEAEGSDEGGVFSAQNHYVGVRLVNEVIP
jgi:hypothetical protein